MGVSATGWLPVRVHRRPGGDVVDWAYVGGMVLDDPFFDQGIERALRSPFRVLFRRETPIDEVEIAAGSRARDPDGLVLHLSRCGSTLLVACLRALAGTTVLSEPGPLETVLADSPDGEARVRRFRSLMRALAPDDPAFAHVVKLDAWATLDLPDVLTAFPDVPWVFVCRDPSEVLVSHQRHRGWHVIPGTLRPERIGLDPGEVPGMDLDEYAAAVLGRILTCALEAARQEPVRVSVVDHEDLPYPGVERAARHFGLSVTSQDRDAFARMAKLDAKNPVLEYEDDRAGKRAELTPAAAAAVEQWAGPAYRALRALGAGR